MDGDKNEVLSYLHLFHVLGKRVVFMDKVGTVQVLFTLII